MFVFAHMATGAGGLARTTISLNVSFRCTTSRYDFGSSKVVLKEGTFDRVLQNGYQLEDIFHLV